MFIYIYIYIYIYTYMCIHTHVFMRITVWLIKLMDKVTDMSAYSFRARAIAWAPEGSTER